MSYGKTPRQHSAGQMATGLPAYSCAPAAERVKP